MTPSTDQWPTHPQAPIASSQSTLPQFIYSLLSKRKKGPKQKISSQFSLQYIFMNSKLKKNSYS